MPHCMRHSIFHRQTFHFQTFQFFFSHQQTFLHRQTVDGNKHFFSVTRFFVRRVFFGRFVVGSLFSFFGSLFSSFF